MAATYEQEQVAVAGAWVVTKSMVCGASAAGTLRPLLLTHRRPGCVRRVDQQTQRWADRESVRAQASRSRGFGGSMMLWVARVDLRIHQGCLLRIKPLELKQWRRPEAGFATGSTTPRFKVT